MAMFDAVPYVAANSALDALALRQRTIAANVANIATPGYRAREVDFETALTRAVQSGTGAATAHVAVSAAPVRAGGSSVDLETQTLSAIDTQLRYQLATQAVDGHFAALRVAMRTA